MKKNKFYRTLIRVEKVSKSKGIVKVVVPAWNSDIKIEIPLSLIPEKLIEKPIFRLIAYVNLNAKDSKDLKFKNWEKAEKLKGKWVRFSRNK